ncbi:MAG: M20 family metallopeptidase [Coprothermobacterota bacterium]|nr:M20 family metallopeptidase [Coprothermobacterota bacterium]
MERTLAILKDLIRIDTSNPPGNEEGICRNLVELFSKEGIYGELISFAPGRPSFYAVLEGDHPGSLILSGHLDTVAPLGSWSFDPLEPIESDDRIFGLGACDMKSGVAVLIDLFFKFLRAGKPCYSLKLLLSADEENKYRGAEAFRKAGLLDDALFVLVAEPTDAIPLIGEKGEFWARTHFQGWEAHGSTPEKGVNAILAQARFLLELEKKMPALPPLEHMGRTTLNVGKIQGGRQPNIVPETCFAELDFRLVNEEQKKEVIHIMEELGKNALPESKFSWETISYKRAMLADLNNPWVQEFLKVYREITAEDYNPKAATFCTDLPTMFPESCPPFVIFGPGNILQAHQPDEFVEILSIKKAASVLEAFLKRALYS